jgi:DNA-binding beta-propeller fold protein YncE
MRRGPFLLIGLLLWACAPGEEQSADLVAPSEPLVWPKPPAAPRIEYLFGFREPGNLGIRPSLFGRLWEAVVGEEQRQMVRPYAVAAEGPRIAVADPGIGVVHLFDLEGKTYDRIDRAGEEGLQSPVGVAFTDDLIFVADSALAKLFAFDLDGDLRTTVEDLERPTGLAFDPQSGRLYVADTLGHRVVVFDAAGHMLFSFGERGTGTGAFNFPSHLALHGGRLYVNDTMNFRVQVLDLEGRPLAAFGRHGDGSGDFAQPKGVAVDSEGHVYVADALFDRVQIFDADGRYLLDFGGTGALPGSFWLPSGVFIAQDRIYVADSYNRRVQVFRFIEGG